MNLKRRFLLAGVAATLALSAVGLLGLTGQERRAVVDGLSVPATRHRHADHATYAGLNNLAGAAAVIFSGTVTGSSAGTAIPGPSGDPVGSDAIPQTDYAISVDRTYKGAVPVGSRTTITETGGSSGGAQVELEGVPALSTGAQYVFFALKVDDGKYYPLAGGAAVANKAADGSFALPSEVGDGGVQIKFTTVQLAAVPAADHLLVMLLSQPLDRIDSDVQSGSLAVTLLGSSPTALSGAVLVAGRVVTLSIAISGRTATGSFTVDDVTYTLQTGVVTPGRDKSVSVEGKVQSSKGVQQMKLQIFDR